MHRRADGLEKPQSIRSQVHSEKREVGDSLTRNQILLNV